MKPLFKSKSSVSVLEVEASAINPAVPNSQDEKGNKIESWKQALSSIKIKL
jgi:hypothetical protein